MAAVHYNYRPSVSLEMLTPFFFLLTLYIAGYVIAIPLGTKLIAIGPLVFPGGVLAASITYPCTDIVHEIYGKKLANTVVTCGLIAVMAVLLLIKIDVSLPSAGIWELKESYEDIMGLGMRMSIAGIVAFILGQYTDVFCYGVIKKFSKKKHLWLRNNLSTAISKFFDVTSFTLIAFFGMYSIPVLLQIAAHAYIAYLIIALMDTPLVYLGVNLIKRAHPTLAATNY